MRALLKSSTGGLVRHTAIATVASPHCPASQQVCLRARLCRGHVVPRPLRQRKSVLTLQVFFATLRQLAALRESGPPSARRSSPGTPRARAARPCRRTTPRHSRSGRRKPARRRCMRFVGPRGLSTPQASRQPRCRNRERARARAHRHRAQPCAMSPVVVR